MPACATRCPMKCIYFGRAADVAYMLDQSHSIENKIEAVLQSVQNVQVAYAKALCVNRQALAQAQQAGDALGAHRILDMVSGELLPRIC